MRASKMKFKPSTCGIEELIPGGWPHHESFTDFETCKARAREIAVENKHHVYISLLNTKKNRFELYGTAKADGKIYRYNEDTCEVCGVE